MSAANERVLHSGWLKLKNQTLIKRRGLFQSLHDCSWQLFYAVLTETELRICKDNKSEHILKAIALKDLAHVRQVDFASSWAQGSGAYSFSLDFKLEFEQKQLEFQSSIAGDAQLWVVQLNVSIAQCKTLDVHQLLLQNMQEHIPNNSRTPDAGVLEYQRSKIENSGEIVSEMTQLTFSVSLSLCGCKTDSIVPMVALSGLAEFTHPTPTCATVSTLYDKFLFCNPEDSSNVATVVNSGHSLWQEGSRTEISRKPTRRDNNMHFPPHCGTVNHDFTCLLTINYHNSQLNGLEPLLFGHNCRSSEQVKDIEADSLLLRFELYNCSGTIPYVVGTGHCHLVQLLKAENMEMQLQIPFMPSADDAESCEAYLHVMFQGARNVLLSNSARWLYRSYIFRDRNGYDFIAHESLLPCTFTFPVATQCINFGIDYLSVQKELTMSMLSQKLHDIITWPNAKESRKKKMNFAAELLNLQIDAFKLYATISRWQQLHVLYSTYHGEYRRLSFKPSVDKNDPFLSFVPTNLHLQNFVLVHCLRNRPLFGYGMHRDFHNSLTQPETHSIIARKRLSVALQTTFSSERCESNVMKKASDVLDEKWVTVGAFCDHITGFKHGGVKHLINELESFNKPAALTKDVNFLKVRKYRDKLLDIQNRWHVVRSYALLATAFAISSHFMKLDLSRLEHMKDAGLLVGFESLLSSFGSEEGMLDDQWFAVRSLENIRVRFFEADSSNASVCSSSLEIRIVQNNLDCPISLSSLPMFSENSDMFSSIFSVMQPPSAIIEIGLARKLFIALPEWLRPTSVTHHNNSHLDNHLTLALFPVMLTQGVNEMQTVANSLHMTNLQSAINDYGLARMRQYASQRADTPSTVMDTIEAMFKLATAKNTKNHHMLLKMSNIVRALNGCIVVSCKSAKDRTSMEVTWEESELLRQFNLDDIEIKHALQLLRLEGVRRSNVYHNTGSTSFSFNLLQRSLLPEELRPNEAICSSSTAG